MKLRLGKIAEWVGAAGEFDPEVMVEGYSIDSRTVGAKELFFAVKGERFDGHDYVISALQKGATAAVVSMEWVAPGDVDAKKLLRVPEAEEGVLGALQRLANAVRRAWGGRVIGVTGSAGKTTTKDAIAQVLGERFRVLKSAGNLNNAFGLPLQLLRLEPQHEVAVMEMGMNHAGEIAALAEIAAPDWGVVSNVAPVHLEFFEDGLEGIARAKYELIEALPADGIAVLNFDDSYVKRFGEDFQGRVLTYGCGEGADIRAVEVEEAGTEGSSFEIRMGQESSKVRLKLIGRHNVSNALAAIAVGVASGMGLRECSEAVAQLRAADRRGEMVEWRGAKIINDCYNSNPAALNSMVEAMLAMPGKRHIVVAGEMLELGDQAAKLHRMCGRHMGQRGVNIVLGVRSMAAELVEGAKESGADSVFLADAKLAGEWMRSYLREGDVVLLKASRGVKLEDAFEVLTSSPLPETTAEHGNAS